MGVGMLIFFALPESPLEAWFLNREKREAAHSRTLNNQAGLSSKKVDSDSVLPHLHV